MTTLYLDTSALAKVYVTEAGTERARRAIADADAVITASLTVAEFGAVLGRRLRDGSLTPADIGEIRIRFARDAAGYFFIDLSRALSDAASDLALEHDLRGADAVHIASALAFRARVTDGDLVVASGDRRMLRVATALGVSALDCNED